MEERRYIRVILPLRLEWEPFYRVPEGMEVRRGDRVSVRFGRQACVGVVSEVEAMPDVDASKILDISELRRELPPVSDEEMRLWRFMADYYLCTVGEVFKAAYPAMRTESEEAAAERLRKAQERAEAEARRKEAKAAAERARKERRVAALRERAEKKSVALQRARKPSSIERYKEELKALEQELAALIGGDGAGVLATNGCKDEGAKAADNRAADCDACGVGSKAAANGCEANGDPEAGGTAAGGTSAGAVAGTQEAGTGCRITLSEAQAEAYGDILQGFREGKPVLLHGVTGSGKTELYLKAAQECLRRGGSVLYLVPEIALSHQLEDRLRGFFAGDLSVYHSAETLAGKRAVAERVHSSRQPYVLLGTRSAIFLPHRRLGLVIVDEEHDSSYKQDNPAPRYNARDMAVTLAKIHGADVILGSATPSFESLYNCEIGRFRLVRLSTRYYESPDSTVEIIDTTAERRKRGMVGDFSIKLIAHIRDALKRGEQVAILRARRAWAPVVSCKECGDTPRCPHCNVTMSYHIDRNALVCHYCGHSEAFTGTCRKCGGALVPLGAGTQKIEDELMELFPEARVARLDSDTARSRAAEKAMIRSFESGGTDILVGTQMLAKGFDFKGLTLVAVLQADSLTGRQDFRADERAVQLLEQLRGRSGRRGQKGLFVIQTAQASHPVYQGFAEGRELDLGPLREERRLFGYPPYSHIILLTVKDSNQNRMAWLSKELHRRLTEASDCEVTAPYAPVVDKVAGQHVLCLRVMIPKDRRQGERKRAIRKAVAAFERERAYAGHIAIDVDPS